MSDKTDILYSRMITQILPHRPPFLFVDEVIKYDGGDRLWAKLFLDPDFLFFKGHFPGNPIMPGVLVAEALAQTAGLLLGLRVRENKGGDNQSYFLARTDLKYVSPALPGQTLKLSATLDKSFGSLFGFSVNAAVDEKTITRGGLTLAGQPK